MSDKKNTTKNKIISVIDEKDTRNFIRQCFREETKRAFDLLAVSIRKDYRKFLANFKRDWELFRLNTYKSLKDQKADTGASLRMIRKEMKSFDSKVSIMEETFLSVYSNIKRNQFLYSYYPEEWNETFLEFKEKIKKENEEFKELIGEN